MKVDVDEATYERGNMKNNNNLKKAA